MLVLDTLPIKQLLFSAACQPICLCPHPPVIFSVSEPCQSRTIDDCAAMTGCATLNACKREHLASYCIDAISYLEHH